MDRDIYFKVGILDFMKHMAGLSRFFSAQHLCIRHKITKNDSSIKQNLNQRNPADRNTCLGTEEHKTNQTEAKSFSLQKQMARFKSHHIIDLPFPGSQ